jgi:hypothetical protein
MIFDLIMLNFYLFSCLSFFSCFIKMFSLSLVSIAIIMELVSYINFWCCVKLNFQVLILFFYSYYFSALQENIRMGYVPRPQAFELTSLRMVCRGQNM